MDTSNADVCDDVVKLYCALGYGSISAVEQAHGALSATHQAYALMLLAHKRAATPGFTALEAQDIEGCRRPSPTSCQF